MLGLWLIKQASQLKREFSLIELGPGRGTLIADILKVCLHIKAFLRKFMYIHVDLD
jgi:SAM-dependent MidA family methyltransferase